MGGTVADLEASATEKKVLYKTTLCAKFVTYGKLRTIIVRQNSNTYICMYISQHCVFRRLSIWPCL